MSKALKTYYQAHRIHGSIDPIGALLPPQMIVIEKETRVPTSEEERVPKKETTSKRPKEQNL